MASTRPFPKSTFATGRAHDELEQARATPEQLVLEDLRRLYMAWTSGELPSEDFIFAAGDLLDEVDPLPPPWRRG